MTQRTSPSWHRFIFAIPVLIGLSGVLSGCDQVQQKLGIEDSAAKAARSEAEGKAVGSACRQSGRAIEDCYSIYSWLPKAPIFEGWRDMDAYMRENKLETITPQLPPPSPPETGKKKKPKPAPDAEAATAAAPAGDKPAEKPAEGAADKAPVASEKR
ncbi:hypothetical protein [Rhodocyclus gracilis]|uniref:hypothetical protein n=1 Tax=Rhodocyclus gracilis TaxID=2929842 RepID=UPI0030F49D0F